MAWNDGAPGFGLTRFETVVETWAIRGGPLAKTDLKAVCKIEEFDWAKPRDVSMPVKLFDTGGSEVFCADLSMRISPKRK